MTKKENLMLETAILVSASIYQRVYNMKRVEGYTNAVSIIRDDIVVPFEEHWNSLPCKDDVDYIEELEKFEGERLVEIEKLYN